MRVPYLAAFFGIVLIATTIWIAAIIPAQTGEPSSARVPLLAVSIDEEGVEHRGGIAHLNLRVVEGSGNVYIHSDPLTKIDTQASTTYAQRYACEYANVNCDEYDFLYSIESSSPIVGGPSAGAAAAATTYAVLTGQRIPQNAAVTGTISSGGVIGNVGGIPQKVEAAERGGISRVIIPYLSNHTPGDERIDVVRAENLAAVIEALGLESERVANATIRVPDSYRTTMREVAQELCSEQDTPTISSESEGVSIAYSRIENLSRDSQTAGEAGDYYTQASHCFNIRVQRYYLQLFEQTQSLDNEHAARATVAAIDGNLTRSDEIFEAFEESLTSPDLNDIQIYSIVEERYRESSNLGSALREEIERESTSTEFRSLFEESTLYSAAYVLARIDSMESWMRFAGFESGGTISEHALRRACTRKLSAATELAEYTTYITGTSVLDVSDIYDAHEQGAYAVCIYQSSLVTARAEAFISTIGIQEEDLPELYRAKRDAAHDAIAEQTRKGHFPVMAYSYYEYAESLSEENLQTALLYIENALSLAELDLYLESTPGRTISFERDSQLAFALGVFTMTAIGFIASAGTAKRSKGRTRQRPARSAQGTKGGRLKKVGKTDREKR